MNTNSKQFASWQQAFEYCVELHQAGSVAEAVEGYLQLMNMQPDNPDLLRLTGLAMSQSGNVEKGLSYLQQAVDLVPENPLAHLHIGFVLKEVGQSAQAIYHLEKVAKLLPDDPASYINLAALYTESHQLKRAVDMASLAVKLAPDMPEAHHNLGFALLESGQADNALSSLQHAVNLRSGFPEAWMHLGRAYSDIRHFENASAAYHECLRLNPSHTGAAVNLAHIWLLQGCNADAIDLYQQVLAKQPERWEARLSLATALADDDRIDEALNLVEGLVVPSHHSRQVSFRRMQLLAHAGRKDDASLLLANELEHDLQYWLTRFDLEDSEDERAEILAEIEKHITDDSERMEDRISAAFTLANHAHSRRDYNRAFTYYGQGHHLLKLTETYDHKLWENDALSVFDIFERWQNADLHSKLPTDNSQPVFIVGMPRSGSSLLEQVLDCHSDIAGGGELVDIGRIAANCRLKGVDPKRMHREACDYLDHLHRLGPETRFVTDKMPHNFQYLGLIGLLFPGAHIIHTRRDPRDNALSLWRQRFVGQHAYAHDLRDIARHYKTQDQIVTRWQAIIPNPILSVDYEDLVVDLEGQVRRVLGFLGVKFEEACLEFYKNPRKVRTASREQVTQPLYSSSVGQWRHYDEHLFPFIEALGA